MRRVSLAIVVALLAAAAAGSQTTTKVSVLLDWTPNPDHAGLYYAQANGLFAAAGLDVTIRAPSEKIYSYLADISRHPEWAAHPLQVDPTSDGAAAVVLMMRIGFTG